MSAFRKNIKIDRGSRETFKLKFNYDIGLASVLIVIYESQTSVEPLISITPTLIDGEPNTYKVVFTSAMTSLLVNDKYIWGIKLRYSEDDEVLIIKGEVKVSWGLP